MYIKFPYGYSFISLKSPAIEGKIPGALGACSGCNVTPLFTKLQKPTVQPKNTGLLSYLISCSA